MKYWDKETNCFLAQNKNKSVLPEYEDKYVEDLLKQAETTHSILVPDENGLPILKPFELSAEQKNLQELNSLTEWFEWYDRQVQEYARCQRLGIEYTNTLGLTLTELDNLAEEKKARINELRQIIGG